MSGSIWRLILSAVNSLSNDCARTSSALSGIWPVAIETRPMANLAELAEIARRLWNNLAKPVEQSDHG
jgi:hypothetical protein